MEPDRVGAVARSADPARGERRPGLAVVTVTRSPGAALDRFLDSVQAATTWPVRVVLADLGSTDGAPERAAQRDGVALLHLREDIGRAAGANRGVAELGPDVGWIAIADPDVEYGEGSLDELLAAAARHPRAGVLGPLVRDPDGPVRPSAGDLPAGRVLPALAGTLLGTAPAVAPAVEGPVGWLGG
ncbi:MAG: glycosyltransferase family 2 protein, partial [Pseudonocardia sp.]